MSCKTPEELQALVKKEGIKLTKEELEVVAHAQDDVIVLCNQSAFPACTGRWASTVNLPTGCGRNGIKRVA